MMHIDTVITKQKATDDSEAEGFTMAKTNVRSIVKKKKIRPVLIPFHSTIYIGTQFEWREQIKGTGYRSGKVVLKRNDGSTFVVDTFYCLKRDMVFLSYSQAKELGYKNLKSNYKVEISPSFRDIQNSKSKKTIVSSDELFKKEIALRKKEVFEAKTVSLKRFLEEDGTELYAMRFPKGSNFQKSLYSNRDCRVKNHKLCPVVAILEDNRSSKVKIGKIYYCKDCGKTYLGKITKNSVQYSRFPDYTFDDWLIYELSDDLKKERRRYPLSVPVNDGDTVILNEGSSAYYGDDLIHLNSNDHTIIHCSIGMLGKKRDKFYYYNNVNYCPTCKKYYLPYSISISELKTKFSGYNFIEASGYKAQLEEDELQKLLKKSDTRVISGEDFLVRTGSFPCRSKGHKVKEITVVVTLIKSNGKIQDAFVPGWYCQNCKCYYISDKTYEKLNNLGVIVAKVFTEKEWNNPQKSYKDFSELSTHSLLNKLGYNVSAGNNLSDSVRQSILATAVDLKLMSISQAVDFLEWLINTRSYDDKYQMAIAKWEKDQTYISKYKMSSRKQVKMLSIRFKER